MMLKFSISLNLFRLISTLRGFYDIQFNVSVGPYIYAGPALIFLYDIEEISTDQIYLERISAVPNTLKFY